jgi:hypothetical protein
VGVELNWEAMGAVGELLGSLLVLVTLVYLAIQTHSIKKQMKAEARYNFVASMADINLHIAQNTQTASVWRKGLEDVDSLSSDERMQFLMYMGQSCNFWSVMYRLEQDGTLPADQWSIAKTDMVSLLASSGGLFFWKHGGREAFDDEFAAFVDGELESQKPAYDMASISAGVRESRKEGAETSAATAERPGGS